MHKSIRYIAIENLPVEYGGFYRETSEFFPEDKASEVIVRKNTSGSIQIPVSEVPLLYNSVLFVLV